jgi:tetratricopeptide (TPR) repeat protein
MSLLGRLGLLAALLFPLGFQAQTAGSRSAPITAALHAGDFAGAVQLAREALEKFPQDAQLWTLEGIGLSAQKYNKEALGAFRHALRISPDYLPALEGAAQIEYEAGSEDAVPLLRRILRSLPADPTSHAMLAAFAYKHGDCEQAVKEFEQSGKLLESQPTAMQQYGSCLVRLKQTDKALPIFQKLVAAHPDEAGARHALAAVQLTAGQPQDALATLQPLLAANDPEVSTMQLAAAAYEANRDTPKAVKILRDAIVKDPRRIALYVDFANIALTHQSFQPGIEMINAGLNLEPKAAPLYVARGVLYVQLADFDKAEADFEMAEELDPHESISAAAQGMAEEEKHREDPDRALAVVRSKLARKPNDPFLLYLQAAILAEKAPAPRSPEFQAAMRSAKKAVTLQPNLVAARDVLAKLYLQAGQTEPAIHECREALRSDPKDQTALYHLILALRRTDHKTEIPELLTRLAAARQDAAREEAEHSRYKLVVAPETQPN